MRQELLYISNLISLSRFLLLGVTVYFLLAYNYLMGGVFIILIWVSDLLDGYFARARNEISELGKKIDPIADKASVITIVIVLLVQELVPLWFVIITVLRDAIILTGGLYLSSKKNIVLQSNLVGKIAVFVIGLTLFFYIFGVAASKNQIGNFFLYHSEFTELLIQVMLFLSIVMIILSLTSYLRRFLQNIK
ncbi:MAG: CDP-alcohol phosphatidyltransferase family protein [Chlorobi bacterium]|nr:CDP-alcohol phosphatidyltransferase family protein [Chlorobiota bacterium]MCI0717197.1 CDP-alcohol phosphatidyltransferase family protein [Chlorobiota bacterium]